MPIPDFFRPWPEKIFYRQTVFYKISNPSKKIAELISNTKPRHLKDKIDAGAVRLGRPFKHLENMKIRVDIPVILCTGFGTRLDEKKPWIRAFVLLF